LQTSNFVERAAAYRAAVKSGEQVACDLVKQACARADRDHAREGELGYAFRFDAEKANRVCRFLELLKHVQGPLADTRLKLEDWQCFILTEIFGWVWRDTGTRRFRRGYVEVPKGNGKSLLAAGVSLFMAFADGEKGADCVCTATSMDQARIVLDTAREMCKKDVGFTTKFNLDVLAHKIEQRRSTSRLRGLPSKGSSIEGISLHGGIIDELHAAKGRTVYDNLRTACSKRTQSLLFIITTAGDDTSGIGYEVHSYTEALLAEEKSDEEFFGIIYTIDENDVWDTQAAAQKANPNWGVSVDARGVDAELNRAKQLASNEAAYRTKHLCQWLSSMGEEPFLQLDKVRKCHQSDLEDNFEGGMCAVGMDLASRLDLCSVVRIHSKKIDDKQHYYVFAKSWLPAATIAKSKNASYQAWLRQGWLAETPGSVTDLAQIEEHVAELFGKYNVRDISFDPLQSNYLVSRLQARFPDRAAAFVEFGQYAKFMTPGMIELETAVADGRVHTANPMATWCFANLRCKRVGQTLQYPTRPKAMDQKIDIGVATVMALRGCSIVPLDETVGSAYDTRGVILL
jgi:phage terminase large subunit-like protein